LAAKSSKNKQANQNTATNNTHIVNNVTNIQVNGMDLLKFLQEFADCNSKNGYDWLKKHQKICAGIGLSAIYLTIIRSVIHGKTLLCTNGCWSNWKSDTPLATILSRPARSIYQELYSAIINKYANNTETDLLMPLVQFTSDLNTELATLETFYKIGYYTQNCKLNWAFWISAREISEAQEKIARLSYYRTLINDSIRIQQVN
jgi:hypothetical protein